jgi:hypothetical protein
MAAHEHTHVEVDQLVPTATLLGTFLQVHGDEFIDDVDIISVWRTDRISAASVNQATIQRLLRHEWTTEALNWWGPSGDYEELAFTVVSRCYPDRALAQDRLEAVAELNTWRQGGYQWIEGDVNPAFFDGDGHSSPFETALDHMEQ